MPLMPAIRPVSSIKSAVANPISAPPMKPEKGVRLCMAIVSGMNARPDRYGRPKRGVLT
jgi:hypothetical protein